MHLNHILNGPNMKLAKKERNKLIKQILPFAVIAAGLALGCGKRNDGEQNSDSNEPFGEGVKTQQAPSRTIHEAAEKGDLKALEKFIAAKTDINSQDGKDGETPLHRAVSRGQTEAVKLLIESGADVNIGRKGDGRTPLADAESRKHDEIAQLLRAKGAK